MRLSVALALVPCIAVAGTVRVDGDNKALNAKLAKALRTKGGITSERRASAHHHAVARGMHDVLRTRRSNTDRRSTHA